MSQLVKILTASDLHRGKRLYDELRRAVVAHKPDVVALVGDVLDAMGMTTEQHSSSEAAEVLSGLACHELVFVRGNHEDMDWWEFAEVWAKTGRKFIALHGEAFVHGPLVSVGFPCGLGDETAYLGMRDPLPEPPDRWLSPLLNRYGPAMRTLWLMHEPPTGTPLTVKSGPVSGNPAWNEAIARFSPLLTISGHDHQSPIKNKRWYYRVGETTCVNLGQSGTGPLHYGLVEAQFAKGTPCLPSHMRISAFPWGETIEVVPNQPEPPNTRIN